MEGPAREGGGSPAALLAVGQEVGPLLLKCSHRSKTATWPGTPGPPCFPSLRPRPGAREPLPPQALLPAPFPGARRARDPPPGFGQTQLEPGPCRATRAPPGGGCPPSAPPAPAAPPPPARLRGLAAGLPARAAAPGLPRTPPGRLLPDCGPGDPGQFLIRLPPAAVSAGRPGRARRGEGAGGRAGAPNACRPPCPARRAAAETEGRRGPGKNGRAESRLPAPPGPGQRPGARGSCRCAVGAWRPARAAQKGKGEACSGPPHPIGFPKERSGASQHVNKISK